MSRSLRRQRDPAQPLSIRKLEGLPPHRTESERSRVTDCCARCGSPPETVLPHTISSDGVSASRNAAALLRIENQDKTAELLNSSFCSDSFAFEFSSKLAESGVEHNARSLLTRAVCVFPNPVIWILIKSEMAVPISQRTSTGLARILCSSTYFCRVRQAAASLLRYQSCGSM
jgi:hypothetical protein